MPPPSLQVPPSTSLAGAASSRSSSEVYPGIWKASAFPAVDTCPIYTRAWRAGSFNGNCSAGGTNCVPDRGLKSICALLPGRGGAHRTSLEQEMASLLLRSLFPAFLCLQVPHVCGGGVSHVSSLETQVVCLCTTSLGLSCPRNHTDPLSPARPGATTTGQLPSFTGFHKPPSSICQPHSRHCQHKGTAHQRHSLEDR